MTEILKRCPFCGGKAKLTDLTKSHESLVECTECGARTRFFSNSEEDAVSAWNASQVEDDAVKYEPTSYSCRACKNATDSEIKRLREALTEIKKTVESAQDTVYPFHLALDSKDVVFILETVENALK